MQNFLQDKQFLQELTLQKNKVSYSKIVILDKDEQPLRHIEGEVISGSLNVSATSSVRRTGSISLVAKEADNDLKNIENYIAINKKIQIFIGFKNEINKRYEDIVWFPLGIFVIVQPNISHTISGVNISISFKDKMCLLNGECGGILPTSITFHNYLQETEDGETLEIENPVFDIIQTLVCYYGNEPIEKIFINDVPLEIKNSVRYTGSDVVYFDTNNAKYSLEVPADIESNPARYNLFYHNDDIGYIYTPFVYAGELISNIGDTVTSVLDRIKTFLGNYEYFYDINGNFVFQEIKNYLNTTYDPIQIPVSGSITDKDNYFVDFSNFSESVYTFEEGNALISSYANTPSYANIKNDYHIWGENQDGNVIHYHAAIKEKPIEFGTYKVVNIEETTKIRLAKQNEIDNVRDYTPTDWRAQLYMQGLEKLSVQQRPDIYEQELLDWFDGVYDMQKQEFKADIVNHPNVLNYFLDFLEPVEKLHDCAIESLGVKMHSYQEEDVRRLYDADIPNYILINMQDDDGQQAILREKCEAEGQSFANVEDVLYEKLALGTVGYSAQFILRTLLYQYTNYHESINLASVPIYYLEPNSRITVIDRSSNINGDYIIQNMSLPLDAKGTMNITASKALERL